MVTKAARKINQTAGSEARRRRQTSADRQQLATERREGLLAAGYWPIPVNGKIPMLDDWTDVRATRDMIERWARNYPNTNTSILTFNAPAIDIDVLDRDVADEIEQVAANILGPNTAVRTGMAPKRAILFRTDEPFSKLSTGIYIDPEDVDTSHKVEVLCDGQQIVVAGIHPDTREPYKWSNGRPWKKLPRSKLPLLSEAKASEFIAAAKDCMAAHGWQPQRRERVKIAATAGTFAAATGPRERAYAKAVLNGCAGELASTAKGERNDTLYKKALSWHDGGARLAGSERS